jgi:serine/threonine protein phosphatase 1
MRYTRASKRFTVLRGNHEQIMLAALAGDLVAAQMWIEYGGAATLKSWGLPESQIVDAPLQTIMMEARQCISHEALAWMSRLRLYCRSGDVLFVHAGVRPGVPLRRQDPLDLMWIRSEFTDSEVQHPFLVVHGHTIFESGLDVRENRVGVDTGAYRTGRLTALALEGDQMWSFSTTGNTNDVTADVIPPPIA